MAYEPLPHDSVAPPPSGILPNTYPDSHAVWTVDVDSGSGQPWANAVMEPDTPPAPPEPEREPLALTSAAVWADLNDYNVGSEVFANVAGYSGGNPDTTIYRYRWQTKATADDAWVNGKWVSYDDHALEVSTTITEGGQIRFQCQARDSSIDPVEQLNSFASVQDVPWPPLKCEEPPGISGEMYVGMDLTGSKAVYSGGIPPVTVESQFQRSDNGTSGWTGVDAWGSDDAGTHRIGPDEAGKYFRVAGRGIDQSEDAISQAETLMSFSEVVGPAVDPSALVVSTPVVTGNAYVGQTLSCSEPTVSGGVGPYQIDYFWVDESNAIIWEATYMGNTTTIIDYDLGKTMKCLVTVTDKGWSKGESTTVESNSVGPIQQPSMGQPRPYVDDEIYDPNSGEPIHLREEQSVELRIDLPNDEFSNPSWSWDVRQGSARLSPNGPYCVVFNQTAMGNPVAVQVDMIDNNSSDSPHSIRYAMFVTTASKDLEA